MASRTGADDDERLDPPVPDPPLPEPALLGLALLDPDLEPDDLDERAVDDVRFLDDPQLDMAVPPYQSPTLGYRYPSGNGAVDGQVEFGQFIGHGRVVVFLEEVAGADEGRGGLSHMPTVTCR